MALLWLLGLKKGDLPRRGRVGARSATGWGEAAGSALSLPDQSSAQQSWRFVTAPHPNPSPPGRGFALCEAGALLRDHGAGTRGEVLRGGQHALHGLLQRQAMNRIDLDARIGGGLDEFGILQRCVEAVAQRLDAIRRYVGGGRERLA